MKPNPKQALVLLSLVFTGAEPKQSELKPRLSPRERSALVKAGLIELERRGRADHIVLTDRAWAWAAENLDTAISERAHTTSTLKAVLARLKAFLQDRRIPLADVLRVRTRQNGAASVKPPLRASLEKRVRDACHAVSGDQPGRVRLAALRSALGDVPRGELDRALLEMRATRKAAFFRLDDPQEIFPADERDALRIDGEPHHVLYLNG